MQSMQTECRSAAEVRARALAMAAKRRASYAASIPMKTPPEKIVSPPQDQRVVVHEFAVATGAVLVELDNVQHDVTLDHITVMDIQYAVCRAANITRPELLSDSRVQKLVLPRQIAMTLCARFTQRSLPDIGRRFNRDHSTVIHARDKIEPVLRQVEVAMPENATITAWARAMMAAGNHMKFPTQGRVARFGPKQDVLLAAE